MRLRRVSESDGQQVLDLVRQKVKAFVGPSRTRSIDQDDVEDHLVTFVVERLHRHCPARGGFRTFVSRLIDSGFADFWRYQTAAKRDYRRTRHGRPAPRTGGPGLDQVQLECGVVPDRPQSDLTSQELLDLRLDVRNVLNSLSREQRQLCEDIMSGCVEQVARDRGCHRGTIYRRLGALQKAFESRGLQDSCA